LKPREPLTARVTSQWGEIGFQGTDPATDFRGMGCLGLDCLLYFAENHTDLAAGLLRPYAPETSYPLAIAGINVAHHLLSLLSSTPALANLVFSDHECDPTSKFAQLFSGIMVEFDKSFVAYMLGYIANGGKRELAVMQFNIACAQFFDRLKAVAQLSPQHPDFVLFFGNALATRPAPIRHITSEPSVSTRRPINVRVRNHSPGHQGN
jgi:hypothetical protein